MSTAGYSIIKAARIGEKRIITTPVSAEPTAFDTVAKVK